METFNTMVDMGLDEDFIYDEAETRRLASGQIDMSIDGEFSPLKYSEPRFESKILAVEENLDKTGSNKDFDEELLFPQDELDEIIDLLEDADLNGEFPFDITTDVVPPVFESTATPQTNNQTSKLPLQPLPPQPAATGITATAAAPINPATGLTQVETALLSPGEQAIRLKQRA